MRKRYFGSVYRRRRRNEDTYLDGYYIRWTDADGKPHHRRGGATRTEAEDALADLQAEKVAARARKDAERRAAGEEPGETSAPTSAETADAAARLTLRALSEEILAAWGATLSAGTMQARPYVLRRWCRRFGDMPVSAITRSDVQRAINAMRTREGYAPVSVRSEVSVLSSIFAVLRRDLGLHIQSPLQDLSLPKVETPPRRAIPPADLDRLIAACHPSIQGMISVAAGTGIRPAELMRLQWSEVAEDLSSLQLTRTKTYQTRNIPLGPRARAALHDARAKFLKESRGAKPAPTETVFRISKTDFWKRFAKASRKAKLRDPESQRGYVTPYRLRHAFACGLLVEGAPIAVVRDLLGHANVRTTDRYLRSLPQSAAADAVRDLARARGETGPVGVAGGTEEE